MLTSSSNNAARQAIGIPQLVRIDLEKPEQVETIDLPAPTSSANAGNTDSSRSQSSPAQLYKIHADPTGRHVIVSFSNGDNVYLFVGQLPPGATSAARKPKPLSRLKGATIESVAWSAASPSSQTSSASSSGPSTNPLSTKEIVLGTRSGQLIETVILDPTLSESSAFSIPGRSSNVERYVKLLYTLPERHAITGVRYEIWSPRRAAVIATTRSRILQFAGTVATRREEDAPLLDTFFLPYANGDAQAKSLELPGDSSPSELHFFATQRQDSKPLTPALALPQSVAWMTGPGIYHGKLAFPHSKSDSFAPGDGIIESASLVPYPTEPTSPTNVADAQHFSASKVSEMNSRSDAPISMALTEWHVILLYRDKLRVLELLSDKVVFEEPLDLSIFELVIKDEDRHVWKIHLSRSNWDLARRYAKTPRQRDTVLAAEADAYFESGRYIQSAQSYAQSSRTFEDVVLRFVDKNERDALRYYLVARLERLKKTDLTQRMMLATWLVEIYLSKLAQLEDATASERATENATNLAVEHTLIEDELKQFLTTYRDELDPYYRYAAVVFEQAPAETVDALMRQPSLDVRQLLPAFCAPRRRLKQSSSDSSRPLTVQHAIRYLQYSILQMQNIDTAVHNAIVTLFATSSSASEAEFLHFLSTSLSNPLTGDPYYDLDYALRVCRANKCVQACVLIYSKMGLYESSVDLALEHNDLELAKMSADQPDDDDLLKKKLWLKIARYVVGQNNDIKEAMRFLESTDLLEIEDVLPFFPDFVVVDDFKEEICRALEDYSSHIDRLKKEMDDATQSAEEIKRDIGELRNRFVVVDANDKCASCVRQLLTRQFYVFPCQHSFHADCLIDEVTKQLSPVALRRMLDLQSRLASDGKSDSASSVRARNIVEDQTLKLAAASVQGLDQLRKMVLPDALLGAIGGAMPSTHKLIGGVNGYFSRGSDRERDAALTGANLSSRARKEAGEKQGLREALDDLLASSCPLCEGSINSLDKGFVEPGQSNVSTDLIATQSSPMLYVHRRGKQIRLGLGPGEHFVWAPKNH
ncbi:tethering complex subunit [Microbotryomycetes sp. JL221]|nr:tethering complex subunit [Microbotryomycetes sp. JL221]